MQSQPVGRIVVGIDGSPASANALDWAANEAERRGAQLLVAHAGDVPRRDAMSGDTARLALKEVCAFGRELLADAVATVLEYHEHIDVRTELREADPADLLIELSGQAQLLVVGRGNGGPLARFLVGSTSQRVAGMAPCPVVVVDALPTVVGTVVVGVSPSEGGRRALEFACHEALTRGAKLLGVRSWTELGLTPFAIGHAQAVLPEPLRAGEAEVFESELAEARVEFPTLRIEGRLTDMAAHLALDEAARDAELLVVGCRRAEGSLLPVLGPLASWVLHHSPCPVAIVSQGVGEQTGDRHD